MPINRGLLHTLGHLFATGINLGIDEYRDYSKIHISQLTACQRQIWLQLNESLPPTLTTMPLIIGSALHGITQNLTQQLVNCYAEVPVSLEPEYPVIGAADLVDDDYVIDLKFVGDYGYRKYLEKGSQAYKIQVLTYAYGLSRKFAAIFMVNRGTLLFKAQMYIVDQHIDQIKYYLTRAANIYYSDHMPARDHSDPNDSECRWCPFKERCWESLTN